MIKHWSRDEARVMQQARGGPASQPWLTKPIDYQPW